MQPQADSAPSSPRPQELAAHLLAWAGLLGATLLLHGSALAGGWRFDDPSHLLFALEHPAWPRYFADPAVYRLFSVCNLTPWNPLLYRINLDLFGLNPAGFYAHHLLSLWLAGVATYYLLRLWVRPAWALAGSLVFLLGLPTAGVAQQLMTGHYVDGLVFTVCALHGFVRAARSGRTGFAWAGGVCYALAVTAKEIYVPLPLLLLVLPEGDWRARLKMGLPFFTVLLAYIPWRWFMLGMLGGGYRGVLPPADTPGMAWNLIRVPLLAFGGGDPWSVAALLLCAPLIWLAACRQPRNTLVFLAALALLLAPLAPLAKWGGIRLQDSRYLFLCWWATAAGLALGLERLARLPRRGAWLAAAAGILIGLALLGRLGRDASRPLLAEHETVGRAILDAPRGRVLVIPPGFPVSYRAFLRLRNHLAGAANSPLLLNDPDELFLAGGRALPQGLGATSCWWVYDPARGRMTEQRRAAPPADAAPLTVEIAAQAGRVRWRFGPHPVGTYLVAITEGGRLARKLPLPPEGETEAAPGPVSFFVRYDSPEGWTATTPELRFDPRAGRLAWP